MGAKIFVENAELRSFVTRGLSGVVVRNFMVRKLFSERLKPYFFRC